MQRHKKNLFVKEAFVIRLGLEPRTLPIKIGMLCQLSYRNKLSIYFLDFIFLITDYLFFAFCNVSKVSVYFSIQGIPVEVNFECPILCSYNLLSILMHAPT